MPHFGRDLLEGGEAAGLLGSFAYDRHLHKEIQHMEQGGMGGGSACGCGCGGYGGMSYQPYQQGGYGGYGGYQQPPMMGPYYGGGGGGGGGYQTPYYDQNYGYQGEHHFSTTTKIIHITTNDYM
eukprot:gnl/Chilomastix_caulleri/1051.p1 GENE.gnl/Chilomastix_caulleri/1051~~gnl/Chilomastix_caulleri/1051.p1  ORF type:complete len:124 (+),score=55.48 gnl/Chilomastix_caulleri/1051:189-560(+)